MNNDILIEFVDRIESRGGLASREEIFIEMLNLYDEFMKIHSYDGLNLYEQLESIYRYLKKEAESIKKWRESYLINPFDRCERCKDRPIKNGCYCTFCQNQLNTIKMRYDVQKAKEKVYRKCNGCGQENSIVKGFAKCRECLNQYKREWYLKKKSKNGVL